MPCLPCSVLAWFVFIICVLGFLMFLVCEKCHVVYIEVFISFTSWHYDTCVDGIFVEADDINFNSQVDFFNETDGIFVETYVINF